MCYGEGATCSKTDETPYSVNLVEYERGWGSDLIATHWFPSEGAALTFAYNYNATHNNEVIVPDIYIKALYGGKSEQF